jgi:uracil-DNA glycosylase
MSLSTLVKQVHDCVVCEAYLPFTPNPIIRVGNGSARIMLIGQAPSTRVHATGIPWNDPSGDRLRSWLGVTKEQFYNENLFALMPMGFCYPGKGGTGDLPPRIECAPLWHAKILRYLPNVKLTLLIGQYAQAYYLGDRRKKSMTETIQAWKEYRDSGYLPLAHPSPRNGIWLRKNPWFEEEVVEFMKQHVHRAMDGF